MLRSVLRRTTRHSGASEPVEKCQHLLMALQEAAQALAAALERVFTGKCDPCAGSAPTDSCCSTEHID